MSELPTQDVKLHNWPRPVVELKFNKMIDKTLNDNSKQNTKDKPLPTQQLTIKEVELLDLILAQEHTQDIREIETKAKPPMNPQHIPSLTT